MSIIKENFKTSSPIPDILPKSWKDIMQGSDVVLFNNLDHFIYTVSKLKQKQDSNCGMSYSTALEKLSKRESDFPKKEQESIRNLVRENLFKRGLITEEVYENFRYSSDGTQVGIDVGKYAAGEADCVITPSRQYIDFFYELYISISYPYNITNEQVRDNVAKLLATVEELERQHIFIKINVVLPINNPKHCSEEQTTNKFFSVIPVFSHKDFKSVDVMSSVVNERLLRKFFFAVLEDIYGDSLHSSYGTPVKLEKAMCIGDDFDEIELFESIKNLVGA